MPVRFENQAANFQDRPTVEKSSTAGIPSEESSTAREPPLQRKKRVTIQHPDSAGESLKYQEANNKINQARPYTAPDDTPQSLVQEVRQKAAIKDEDKIGSKALQYKAGLRPTNPPRLAYGKSEYQRQYDWKKLPERASPIIAADNTIFKSSTDIAPVKVDMGPRPNVKSEYQRQYQDWRQSMQQSTKPAAQDQSSRLARPSRSIDERSESSLDTTKSILDGDYYNKKEKSEDIKASGYKDKISDYMERLDQSENPDRPFFPHRRRKKFTTEYQEHFKAPFLMAYRGGSYDDDNSPVISPDGTPSWYKQILELREKVQLFRERSQQGTFFTRKNLLVMEMEQEDLWEPASDTSRSGRENRTTNERGSYSTTSKKVSQVQQLPPSQPKEAWTVEANENETEESNKADEDYDDEETLSERPGNGNIEAGQGNGNDQFEKLGSNTIVERRNPIDNKAYEPKSKSHDHEQTNGFVTTKSNSDGLNKEYKGNLKNVDTYSKAKTTVGFANHKNEATKENRNLTSDSNIRPPKSSNLRRKFGQNATTIVKRNENGNVAANENSTDRGYYSNSHRNTGDNNPHDGNIAEISDRISKLKNRLLDDRESVSSMASSYASDVLERSKQRKENFWGRK
ncbi:Nuclear protein MDM1 [Trichoplax sp. H2]|nr:Nuclear protein MDM1 [Trichoplax sp. H2]|eukprot:RDD37966.1 Nuclear protein MDM1 [Trichoplax sp. H2]